MRVYEIWDEWLLYDDDGFVKGIDPKAPEDVITAYKKHLEEVENNKQNGLIPKY